MQDCLISIRSTRAQIWFGAYLKFEGVEESEEAHVVEWQEPGEAIRGMMESFDVEVFVVKRPAPKWLVLPFWLSARRTLRRAVWLWCSRYW